MNTRLFCTADDHDSGKSLATRTDCLFPGSFDRDKMAARSLKSVFRPGLFEGKVAIVTGGGTGIGKSIARELLYLGGKVVIASRKEERLIKTAQELTKVAERSRSAEVKVIPCNIRDEAQVSSKGQRNSDSQSCDK